MPKPARGIKRVCQSCGTRFYDLGRTPIVCPSCQEERPDWSVQLDRCEACGATRLSAMLGQVVCRACGHVRGEQAEPAWFTGA